MKKISVIVLCLFLAATSQAQLKAKVDCGAFDVDVLDGKVNGLKPNTIPGQIKRTWTCFTGADSAGAKCGEAIYYKDKGITFYTDRDYIEIAEGFKGKMSIPLLGAARGSLFKHLGNPRMKDNTWDAYQTSYGVLILHYNKANKVRLIQMSTETTGTIQLCE